MSAQEESVPRTLEFTTLTSGEVCANGVAVTDENGWLAISLRPRDAAMQVLVKLKLEPCGHGRFDVRPASLVIAGRRIDVGTTAQGEFTPGELEVLEAALRDEIERRVDKSLRPRRAITGGYLLRDPSRFGR